MNRPTRAIRDCACGCHTNDPPGMTHVQACCAPCKDCGRNVCEGYEGKVHLCRQTLQIESGWLMQPRAEGSGECSECKAPIVAGDFETSFYDKGARTRVMHFECGQRLALQGGRTVRTS